MTALIELSYRGFNFTGTQNDNQWESERRGTAPLYILLSLLCKEDTFIVNFDVDTVL